MVAQANVTSLGNMLGLNDRLFEECKTVLEELNYELKGKVSDEGSKVL